jgi:hypothetical protein
MPAKSAFNALANVAQGSPQTSRSFQNFVADPQVGGVYNVGSQTLTAPTIAALMGANYQPPTSDPNIGMMQQYLNLLEKQLNMSPQSPSSLAVPGYEQMMSLMMGLMQPQGGMMSPVGQMGGAPNFGPAWQQAALQVNPGRNVSYEAWLQDIMNQYPSQQMAFPNGMPPSQSQPYNAYTFDGTPNAPYGSDGNWWGSGMSDTGYSGSGGP